MNVVYVTNKSQFDLYKRRDCELDNVDNRGLSDDRFQNLFYPDWNRAGEISTHETGLQTNTLLASYILILLQPFKCYILTIVTVKVW